MGNSSSKSDKKQKKEEPTAAVEDVPVKQEERFFTRTLSEQSDWDLLRPPMACAAVCPDYLDTSDTIEITASPIISHVPETVTTTAVTPTPPLIEEPLNPDTDSDDSEEVIEPPRRPQMACSSAQPQYIIEKPRPAFLEEPTSLTEPPKPPELPMPSLIPQHIDENPPVIEEPTPIDKPLRARPRMACSSINPKYLKKKPQKEEKKKVPITTIADYVPDLSITALLARPQMACSSINPAYLNKINEKKEVIIPVPTAPITTTLQEEDTEPLINSPVERPEMACYTVCPDYLDNSSDEEAYNLLCDSPKAPSSPKPSPLELINLSIDLFPVVKHLFRFLEAIDEVPRDPIKNLMAFALHRYNKWLDFINWCIETGQDDVDHRPPFDIEVVWVAHVIRTDEYKADCLRLFGREIPHVFDHKSGAHTSVSETTRKLWKERTGSDLVMNTEKFFNLASVFASNLASGTISDQNKTSITVCILIEDMKWFHDFRDFYPRSLVSLLSNTPSSIASSSSASEEEEEIQQNLKREFGAKETPLDLEISESDKTFLEEAHRDYLRFLALQKKYNFTRGVSREEGAGSICATYKIDLFWHSHMLNTREYRRDCESYLGDIVPHAPWPTEAVDIQHHKFNFTGDLWQKEFGDEFQATKP